MLNWMVHLKGGPKRACHAAVTVGHKVYSFGGFCTMETYRYDRGHIDVHVFNAVSLSWTKLPPVTSGGTSRGCSRPPLTLTTGGGGEHQLDVPSMRYGHTAALTEDVIYIWGGIVDSEVEEYCNVLYAFDVDTHGWFKPRISGSVPETRRNHSACVLGKVMYIFGGFNERTRYTNNIYTLDTTTMVWALINTRGTPPPVSECHSATIIGTKVFVFGGQASNIYYSIRVFDTETNSWLSTPSPQLLPEGRECHSAFAYDGELYIFGGQNCSLHEIFNDLWKFNPETCSWKNVEPKGEGPCSWMYRMCCCMVGDRIILFGGNTDDLYVLDLSPGLKELCKLAVIQYGLQQSELPHDVRWELAAMTTNSNRRKNMKRQRRKKKKIIDNGREVKGSGTEEMERRGYRQPSKVA